MKNEVNGEITINTTTLNPTQEETPDLIQRLEPDDAQQTLGIHIAPMGTGKFYLTMLNGGATASPNKADYLPKNISSPTLQLLDPPSYIPQ